MRYFYVFLVFNVCICCESPTSKSYNSQDNQFSCDLPSQKQTEKIVTPKEINEGNKIVIGLPKSLTDFHLENQSYTRHYLDQHGTKWEEAKEGAIRVVYDESKTLKFYIGKRLVGKHKDVELQVIKTSTLDYDFCIYKILSRKAKYLSNGKTILTIDTRYTNGSILGSNHSISYYPDGQNIKYSGFASPKF